MKLTDTDDKLFFESREYFSWEKLKQVTPI